MASGFVSEIGPFMTISWITTGNSYYLKTSTVPNEDVHMVLTTYY